MTTTSNWSWKALPPDPLSGKRLVLDCSRLAAEDAREIVQSVLDTYPNVKFATSFPVFFRVRLATIDVPGSPTDTPEAIISADQISSMLTETEAVAFLEMVPGKVPQSDVALNENVSVPAEGYGNSVGLGLNARATFPYPISPGSNSIVEGAAVAVHLCSSAGLDPSRGVSCWNVMPFPMDGVRETWARVSLDPRLCTIVTSKSIQRLKFPAMISSTVMSLAPPVTEMSNSTMLSISRVV